MSVWLELSEMRGMVSTHRDFVLRGVREMAVLTGVTVSAGAAWGLAAALNGIHPKRGPKNGDHRASVSPRRPPACRGPCGSPSNAPGMGTGNPVALRSRRAEGAGAGACVIPTRP